ncbi:AMP-dependent synthetase [Saccharomonospora sp. CUA-673]|uniref:acyl-CoA synthetase n=1 Tax=Saccharomonospora sp. CUA-673 TaxID=1904969 RepID=UPI000961FEA3|nr:long-chain fatty acid--CoA ligase [Saccharomonospora sp. CUA-673]OLT45454.1 AMP-dependent synthetase [Saccharomonospora sp. CUA-673]
MRNQGLGSWPDRRARMTPTAVAVVHEGRELTYGELRDRVRRLASVLAERGVRAGDRVAYLGPNHPAYLETLFACGVLGAVFVPVNSRLTASEVDFTLADSGATVLVHTADRSGVVAELAALDRLTVIETGPAYEELLAASAPDDRDVPVELDEVCLIMYTSGSTGRPKGAMLTHGNLTWNSINVIVESDIASDERTLVVAPLFHTAALGMVCLPTLLKGGRVVLQSGFDPAEVLRAVERERITVMFGVPTMYDAVAADPGWETADLSSVRTLLCGGAPVPIATIRRYLERGLSFVQGYGMTETAPGALLLDRNHVTDKIGSAGVPSFFTDVRVVDSAGVPVAAGQRGEVVVSGPNVMRGYWDRPDETAAALRDGWFHSGDVATVDEDGYVFVVDRVKDVIISGGENIYPAEVENELHELAGVQACAVIGVPDAKWGEVGKAVVVLEPGAAPDAPTLLDGLRGRLASYKIPKTVEFAEALPVTGSGKVRKGELRRRYR